MFRAEAGKATGMLITTYSNPEWMAAGLHCARRYLPVGELMGQDFRRILVPFIGEPKSPGHTWGALVNAAVWQRIIKRTAIFRKSTAVANHAHRYVVYVKEK
jgi:hypothetical protein